MKVADIGAGYGFFAFPAAEIVGKEGLVYAVEPNARRVAEISKRVGERDVKNLKVLEAGVEDIGEIPAGEVDIAMSMSSFHHFTDARRGLVELGRIVRPGGLVYIRDIKAGRIMRHGGRSRRSSRRPNSRRGLATWSRVSGSGRPRSGSRGPVPRGPAYGEGLEKLEVE